MKKNSPLIRILLVDDHAMVRLGLRTLIEASPGLAVVGEAESIEQAMSSLKQHKPHLVLLDLRLKDGSGIDLCRRIKSEPASPKVLVLTSYASDTHLIDAVEAGAEGYVLKDVDGTYLVDAIHRVMTGENIFDPSSTLKILRKAITPGGASSPLQKLRLLSIQERRVLEILAQGKTNKEIGTQLGLSHRTVKNYIFNLMGKLGLSRRTEAAAFFLTHQRDAFSAGLERASSTDPDHPSSSPAP
ncbi:MAG: response regulator transcription factor [Candidatus Methylacidiphilales bacterium]|nr:response regulator transcription factor [Candidatus Methylacidiphilales bacterium]